MTIGANAELGYRSVLAVGNETTFGTAPTTTALTDTFEFLSNSLKLNVDELKSPEINSGRGYTRRYQLNRSVSGTIEKHLHPIDGISLFQHALGGALTTAAGSTSVYNHTINVNNGLDLAATATSVSLAFDVRKGPTKAKRYTGCRINQMTVTGEIGSPITVSYDVIGQNSASITAIADEVVSFSSVRPFLYTDGKFQYDNTLASITTTSEEQIVGFVLTVNNNLVADTRAIGTNAITSLPAGMRDVSLKLTMRVDTNTSYDRFINGTAGAVKLSLEGPSLTAATNYGCVINIPNVYYNNCDPEIGDGGVITFEPELTATRTGPTTTAYDIQAVLTNNVSGY